MSLELDDLHDGLAAANFALFGVERGEDGRPTGRRPTKEELKAATDYRAHCYDVLTTGPSTTNPFAVDQK